MARQMLFLCFEILHEASFVPDILKERFNEIPVMSYMQLNVNYNQMAFLLLTIGDIVYCLPQSFEIYLMTRSFAASR